MKITYKIEQYEVDNFIVVITSPEYLSGLHTRIHTPHFLLSELQQNIKTNLKQTIRRFCIKHKQYSDIVRNETFEFEPDEKDKYGFDDNSCWFYTGKFINDTNKDISDEDRWKISYENLVRYDNAYAPAFDGNTHLVVDPRYMKNKIGCVKIVSLDPRKAIDVYRIQAAFGISTDEIYKWVTKQNKFAPYKGNEHNNKIIFPRCRQKKNKHDPVTFPISELQKYLRLLYRYGGFVGGKKGYPSIRQKYLKIKEHLIDYSKTNTPPEIRTKFDA